MGKPNSIKAVSIAFLNESQVFDKFRIQNHKFTYYAKIHTDNPK